MANIVDRLAKNHALVGFVGRVDIAVGEQGRKLLDLFIDIVASAPFN